MNKPATFPCITRLSLALCQVDLAINQLRKLDAANQTAARYLLHAWAFARRWQDPVHPHLDALNSFVEANGRRLCTTFAVGRPFAAIEWLQAFKNKQNRNPAARCGNDYCDCHEFAQYAAYEHFDTLGEWTLALAALELLREDKKHQAFLDDSWAAVEVVEAYFARYPAQFPPGYAKACLEVLHNARVDLTEPRLLESLERLQKHRKLLQQHKKEVKACRT